MNHQVHNNKGVKPHGICEVYPFGFTGMERDEEKEMSGGHFASERGEEPRSGTLSPPTLRMLPTPSSYKKKRPLSGGLFLWSWRESNPPFPMLLIILYVSNLCFPTGLRF